MQANKHFKSNLTIVIVKMLTYTKRPCPTNIDFNTVNWPSCLLLCSIIQGIHYPSFILQPNTKLFSLNTNTSRVRYTVISQGIFIRVADILPLHRPILLRCASFLIQIIRGGNRIWGWWYRASLWRWWWWWWWFILFFFFEVLEESCFHDCLNHSLSDIKHDDARWLNR